MIRATQTTAASSDQSEAMMRSMLSKVQESLDQGTFVALTIKGPCKKTAQKLPAERLRGCLRLLTGRLLVPTPKNKKGRRNAATASTKKNQSNGASLLLQMTFKYHGATDIVKNWPLSSTESNLMALFQWTDGVHNNSNNSNSHNSNSHYDFTVTDAASEWGPETLQAAPPGTLLGVQGASLETTESTWELDIAARTKQPRLLQRRAAAPTGAARLASRAQPHDRTKQVPLSNQAAFLRELGVTSDQGKPKQGMASKLRQCQKFVEIAGRLVDRAWSEPSKPTRATANTGINNDTEETGSATKNRDISVMDMGCGRGYLTFSLHSHLQDKYGKLGYTVRSRGIDVRPKLVQEISAIARALDKSFDSLTFEEGVIEDFLTVSDEPKSPSSQSLDVLIALHACDTATDDALWSGIARQADVIVVAPCCHKQVRSQLDTHVAKNPLHPLADVLRHNIYRERLAETVTDSIRALLLEIAGYNVQVFEFIGGEHTSKNVMITAVKQSFGNEQTQGSTSDQEALRKRLKDLASLHGIREQKLAKWMGERVRDVKDDGKDKQVFSAHTMPPL